VAIPKSLEGDIVEQIIGGNELAILPIDADHSQNIKDLVHFIQVPPMNPDVWQILDRIHQNFQQRTGLSDLLYGQSSGKQIRTASEAQIRGERAQHRPEDMANLVEDWMALVGRNEAISARVQLTAHDVAPVLGEPYSEDAMVLGPYTQLWQALVQSNDIGQVVAELDYRIESGSARKPNKSALIQQVDEGVQTLAPLFYGEYQRTGNPGQINAFLKRWASARDWPDWQELMFTDMQQQMMAQQQVAMQGAPQQQGGVPPK
jgi:hypothetical protein